jgi:hypothetical protein
LSRRVVGLGRGVRCQGREITRAGEEIFASKTVGVFIKEIGVAGMSPVMFLGIRLYWEGAAVQVFKVLSYGPARRGCSKSKSGQTDREPNY